MNIHPVDTTHHTAESDKRDRIMRAALALFAERGFHGTPVPLVAERAQVGAGTIYRYFASKEALVNALYRHWKQAFLDAVMKDFPADKPPRGQWSHVFRSAVAFAQKHPEAFDFLELHHHAAYLDQESKALESSSLNLAKNLLGATRLQQLTRDEEPMLILSLLWGGVIRFVRCGREGLLALTPETIERFESLCWESLRA